MMQNLRTCRAFTDYEEGDTTVSKDPNDPGNWSSGIAHVGTLIGTKYGISAPVLIDWYHSQHESTIVTPEVMANMTLDTADAIFGAKYFNAMGCPALPSGLDLMVCDMGFNAGSRRSVELLQGMIDEKEDGFVGDETLNTLKAIDPMTFVEDLSKTALIAIQKQAGVIADGVYGPKTKAAFEAKTDKTFILCAALADVHLHYYEQCADWSLYHVDWTRRVWDRLDAGLKLIA